MLLFFEKKNKQTWKWNKLVLITFSSSSCTLAAVTALPQSSQKDVWQENKGKQGLSPSTRKNVSLSGYEYCITVPTTTWNFPGTVLEQGSLKSCVREATSTHDLWSVSKMIKSLTNLRGCPWCNFLLYAFKDLPRTNHTKLSRIAVHYGHFCNVVRQRLEVVVRSTIRTP